MVVGSNVGAGVLSLPRWFALDPTSALKLVTLPLAAWVALERVVTRETYDAQPLGLQLFSLRHRRGRRSDRRFAGWITL